MTLGQPSKLHRQDGSKLEEQFERTLGMLLGFESVRLAMMIDDTGESIGHAPAIHALPSAVNVAVRRIPHSLQSTAEIEPLASMVPNDCYYVRCGSIQNYAWLRQFLISWGGSLDEVVTNPSLGSDIRSRIEDQLGINYQESLEAGMSAIVSDMAIIGKDVFFEEGAGIWVILETRSEHERELETIVQQLRLEKSKLLGASQHSESLANRQVSYFHTPDNRMRSFYVRIGRYLLVTNSQKLVTSVLGLPATSQSLANLHEYRYALETNPLLSQAGVTMYLSDPFFRRLTSPAFRIELGRRRESAKDCRKLEVTALVAKAFGHKVDSRQSLIASKFLPADFGLRPDGSRV